jgi:chromosome segregation ATPase
MNDHINDSEDPSKVQVLSTRAQKPKKNALDTFFPSTLLLVLMVVLVLGFNLVVGIKVFTLQKEKAVIEVLKAQYESYRDIIDDVGRKQQELRGLHQEISPLERRKDDALNIINEGDKKIEVNSAELNKIKSLHSEIEEDLNAMRKTVAELSNEKQGLREEINTISQSVAELKIQEEKIDKSIIVKNQQLRTMEEEVLAAKVRLKEQEKYIVEVASANSSFDSTRGQLAQLMKKMDQDQTNAGQILTNFQKVVAGIEEENTKFSSQNKGFVAETGALHSTNASIGEELKLLEQKNGAFKLYVEGMSSLSKQMQGVAEMINGLSKKIETDQVLLSESAGKIKTSLITLSEINQDVDGAKKQLQTAVTGINAQNETFASYIKTFSAIPDMKGQTAAFVKVLGEIQQMSTQLNQSVSVVQKGFDGKVEGMTLSFGSLEKEFLELSAKTVVMKQMFEKMVSQARDPDGHNQVN